MPLKQSGSKAAQSENISRLVHEGYPQKQAVAISYDIKRKNDAMSNSEKLAEIVGKTDALTKRFDAFIERRKARFDDYTEAKHPRNANGVFVTAEGEEGKEDSQLNPGKLSKRDLL